MYFSYIHTWQMPFILVMFGAATAQNTQVGDAWHQVVRIRRSLQGCVRVPSSWRTKFVGEHLRDIMKPDVHPFTTRIPLFRAIFCTFKNNQKLNEMVAMTSSYATLLYHCMLNLSGCWIIVTIYPGQSYHMEFRNFNYLQKERNFPNHFWRFQLS